MSGFDACRFDFKLDAKNGLTPSKRKKTEKRPSWYNTLFKCKECGRLFDTRSELLEHKLEHSGYKCPFCDEKACSKATLKYHLLTSHGIGNVRPNTVRGMLEKRKSEGVVVKVEQTQDDLETPQPLIPNTALDHQVQYALFKQQQQQLMTSHTPPSPEPEKPEMKLPDEQQRMVQQLFEDFQQHMLLPTSTNESSSSDIPSASTITDSVTVKEEMPRPFAGQSQPPVFPQNIVEHPYKPKDYRFHHNSPENPPVPVKVDDLVPPQGYICINVPVMLPPLPESTAKDESPTKSSPQVATVSPFLSPSENIRDLESAEVMMPSVPAEDLIGQPAVDVSQLIPDADISGASSPISIKPDMPSFSSENRLAKASPGPGLPATNNNHDDRKVSILRTSNEHKPIGLTGSPKLRRKPRHQKRYPGLSSETKDKLEQKLQQKMQEKDREKQMMVQQMKLQQEQTMQEKDREKQIMVQQMKLQQEILKQQKDQNGNQPQVTPPAQCSNIIVDGSDAMKAVQQALTQQLALHQIQQLQQLKDERQMELQNKQKLWHQQVESMNDTSSFPHVQVPDRVKQPRSRFSNTSKECIVIEDDGPLDLSATTPGCVVGLSGNTAAGKRRYDNQHDEDVALDLVSQQTKQKRLKTGLNGMVAKLWESRIKDGDREEDNNTDCPNYTETIKQNQKHSKSTPQNGTYRYIEDGIVECSFCTHQFGEEDMPQHMLFFHGVNTSGSPSTGQQYQCLWNDCNQAFGSVNELTDHVKIHEGTALPPEPEVVQPEVESNEKNEMVSEVGNSVLNGSASPDVVVPVCVDSPGHQDGDMDHSLLACNLCNYSSNIHYTMFLHMKREHNVNDPKIITQLMRSVTETQKPEDSTKSTGQPVIAVPTKPSETQATLMAYMKAIELSPAKLSEAVMIKNEPNDDSGVQNGYHLLDVTNINAQLKYPNLTAPVGQKQLKTFPCKACNFRFDSEVDLQIHRELADGVTHPSGIMPCKPQTQTGFYFSDLPPLKNEMSITDHVKNQVNELLARRRRIGKRPRRAQNGSGPKMDINEQGNPVYRCDCCEFTSLEKPSLDTHTLGQHGFVTDSKEFFCGHCGCQFNSRASLKVHVSVAHMPEDGRSDDVTLKNVGHREGSADSDRSDASSKSIEPGTLVIAEDNPMDSAGGKVLCCQFPGCDKAFKVAKHLKVHQMLHTDEKPLKCTLCVYSCRQRNSMNWHMTTKHNLNKHVTCEGKTIYVKETHSYPSTMLQVSVE